MISYQLSLYALLTSFVLLQSCNHVGYQGQLDGSEGQPEATAEPTECIICTEPLEEETSEKACNTHSFHHSCIVNTIIAQYDLKNANHYTIYDWETAKSEITCPCCRKPITNPVLLKILENGLLLLTAVQIGDKKAVEDLLIVTNVNPNTVSIGKFKNTPLHLVKDIEIAELLIHAGADLNAPNALQHRPLHVATHENNLELMELLIREGAEIDSRIDWLWTPLYFAVQSGYIKAMNLLIGKGADVNAQANLGFNMKDGRITPLHFAALFGQVEALELLIKTKGIDLEAKAIFDCTPLAMAVLTSNKHFRALFPDIKAHFDENTCNACITALKEAGANVEHTNHLGLSLETLAKTEDFPREIRLI